jgi:hypothetical protein
MKKAWLYKLDKEHKVFIPVLISVNFSNDWVVIKNGHVVIRKGYAWDGCSPKFGVFGLFNIGVPDGALRLGKPWTYYASVVHDVLCQFEEIPITKKQSVDAFDFLLKECNWPLRRVYVFFVNVFCPQKFKLDF